MYFLLRNMAVGHRTSQTGPAGPQPQSFGLCSSRVDLRICISDKFRGTAGVQGGLHLVLKGKQVGSFQNCLDALNILKLISKYTVATQIPIPH